MRPATALLLSAIVFGLIHVDYTTAGLAYTRVPFAIFVGHRPSACCACARARWSLRSSPTALLNTITFLTVVVTGDRDRGGRSSEAATGVVLLVGGSALTVMADATCAPSVDAPRTHP